MMKRYIAIFLLIGIAITLFAAYMVSSFAYAEQGFTPKIEQFDWWDKHDTGSYLIKDDKTYYSYYSAYSNAVCRVTFDINFRLSQFFSTSQSMSQDQYSDLVSKYNKYIEPGDAVVNFLNHSANTTPVFFSPVNTLIYPHLPNGFEVLREYSFSFTRDIYLGKDNPFDGDGVGAGGPYVSIQCPWIDTSLQITLLGTQFDFSPSRYVYYANTDKSGYKLSIDFLDNYINVPYVAFQHEVGVRFDDSTDFIGFPNYSFVYYFTFDDYNTIGAKVKSAGVLNLDFTDTNTNFHRLTVTMSGAQDYVSISSDQRPNSFQIMFGIPVFYTIDEKYSGGMNYGGWTANSCGTWDIPCHLGNALGYLVYEFPLTKPITNVLMPLVGSLQTLFDFMTEFEILGTLYTFVMLLIVSSIIFAIVRS